jgi:hypothetical protein
MSPVQRIVINIECLHQAINTLVNTQKVSTAKIVDSSSIQCAESKYGIRIQFFTLVVIILKCGLMRKIVLRIKPHFMYHDNWSEELNSNAVFGFSALN